MSSSQQGYEDLRPGFHRRHPTELAAEAELGSDGAADVAIHQDNWRQIFEVIEEEEWPDQPEGPLAMHWKGIAGPQSTHYIINIARQIGCLLANASPGIDATLIQRLRTMLRPPDDHTYEEALVELEVGGMIAQRITPVLLEPLVPQEQRHKPGAPRSPDYGFRVPEGLVTAEVTVWHWEAYASWQRMRDTIISTLTTRMMKRGVSRTVHILLPIGSPQETVDYLWSHEFCDQVCNSESGSIALTEYGAPRPIVATWQPTLHFADYDSVDPDAFEANGGLPAVFGPVTMAFGVAINPCIAEDDIIAGLESLRRSIDRKKSQCDRTLPHLVALGSTFPQIAVSPDQFAKTWDVFGPLIAERLWPNPKYRWLSGALLHTTHREAPLNELCYWIDYMSNPNAAVPAPETAARALTGEVEFHAMWQRPRGSHH